MADFATRAGDTAGSLQVTLTLPSGTAQDVTGATIKYVVRLLDSPEGTGTEYAGSIVTAASGIVKCLRSAMTILDTPGMYQLEVQVTFSDATILTFPNSTFLTIESQADYS